MAVLNLAAVPCRVRVVPADVRRVVWFAASPFSSVLVPARVAQAVVPVVVPNLADAPASSAVARTRPVPTAWDTRHAPEWA